jgi:hypothetical protein
MLNILSLSSVAMTNKKEKNIVRVSSNLRNSLGLELGDMVSIDKMKFYVSDAYQEDIDRSPNTLFFSDVDFKNLKEYNLEISSSPPNKITIGCDPEFFLTRETGALVDASYLLPFTGKIGSDGVLGELRPDPSDGTQGIMFNLRNLIIDIQNNLRKGLKPSNTGKVKYIPQASSYIGGYMSGFHVHLGIPRVILKYPNEECVHFIKSIIKTLDYFVGIPSVVFEDTDKRRLSNSEYAKAGDFRISDCTLEYRFPGGFFLKHPEYSRILLESCYTVTEDIIGRTFLLTKAWTNMKNFCYYNEFKKTYNLLDSVTVADILRSRGKEKAKAQLESIMKSYEKLYGYNRSKKFIDRFFEKPLEIYQDKNFAENWGYQEKQ